MKFPLITVIYYVRSSSTLKSTRVKYLVSINLEFRSYFAVCHIIHVIFQHTQVTALRHSESLSDTHWISGVHRNKESQIKRVVPAFMNLNGETLHYKIYIMTVAYLEFHFRHRFRNDLIKPTLLFIHILLCVLCFHYQ